MSDNYIGYIFPSPSPFKKDIGRLADKMTYRIPCLICNLEIKTTKERIEKAGFKLRCPFCRKQCPVRFAQE